MTSEAERMLTKLRVCAIIFHVSNVVLKVFFLTSIESKHRRCFFTLQQMQAEVDNLNGELKRKTASEDMVKTEKDRLLARIKSDQGEIN